MKRLCFYSSAGAMLLLTSLPLAAQDDSAAMEQMQKCRDIADTEERLACFDNISEPTVATEEAVEPAAEASVEVPAETPAAGAAAATAATVSTEPEAETASNAEDDFGLPKAEENRDNIQARVSRCGEANNRKFYFYLDNGQIWEYLGRQNPRYRSCDSPVTITEDGLGFYLQMDDDTKHRVRRYK